MNNLDEEGEEHVRAGYGRLFALKAVQGSDNVFRLNHSIALAG